MRNIRNILLAGLFTVLATGTLSAAEGQFYLAPGLQWMEFDDGLDLDEDIGYFAGFGYDFTDRISAEISTFDLDPETAAGSDIDVDHYKFDFFYGLNDGSGSWQPFVVTGFGNTKFEGENDTIWDIGGGVKYKLSDNLTWRTAARAYTFLGRDTEDRDWGIDTALIWYFGGDSSPRRETASPAPAPAPAPAARPETPAPADDDRDGVPDSADACPDTPRNYAVDAEGCPIPVEEVARVELLVNFEFDRSEVRPQYFDEIEEVADFMEQYPDLVIELEGHTDGMGTEEYNQGLSERRANAVRDVLIERFDVQGSRITATGFGESQPIASNDSAAGRAENRRVITVIIRTLQNYQPR